MLSLYSVGAASQARLGEPIHKTKKEMATLGYEILKGNDSVYIMQTDQSIVKYIVDEFDFVDVTVIYPRTERSGKILINYYNNNFQKSGDSKWIFRQNGDSCYITKVNMSNLKDYYFVWSYSPQLKRSYEASY